MMEHRHNKRIDVDLNLEVLFYRSGGTEFTGKISNLSARGVL